MLLDTLPVWEEELITAEEDIILLLLEDVLQVEQGEVVVDGVVEDVIQVEEGVEEVVVEEGVIKVKVVVIDD